MKKTLFLPLLLCLFCISISKAQDCLPGGYTFTKQLHIDKFKDFSAGCINFGGDLIIADDGSGSIENLLGLENLEVIGGSLIIQTAPNLTSLEGLENLKTIGGSFKLQSNTQVEDFLGFEEVISIGGDFIVEYPTQLAHFNGLTNLESIGGDFIVGDDVNANNTIRHVRGFKNLQSIGGNLEIRNAQILKNFYGLGNNIIKLEKNLVLSNNKGMTDFIGFELLRRVAGTIQINGNDNLYTFDKLASLKNIGDLRIENNGLKNLSGLETIINIKNTLHIEGNPDLLTSEGMSGLEDVGGHIIIANNASLTTVSGFSALTNVSGDFDISENPQLNDIRDINQLQTIGGSLLIKDNPLLSKLSNFASLQSAGEGFFMKNCKEFESFDEVQNVNLLGGLKVESCGNLTDLSAFANVSVLDGPLHLIDNNSLTSLSGLDIVTMINGSLLILENPKLENVDALSNVTVINSTIRINDNASLNSLSGLENVDYSSFPKLEIKNNASLAICNETSICDFLMNAGSAKITGNSSGCNTTSQITNACGPGLGTLINEDEEEAHEREIGDKLEGDKPLIYPNPANSNVNITYKNLKNAKLRINDFSGKSMMYLELETPAQINLDGLPSGTYFLQLETDDGIFLERLVKY